jgi:hypothetical protein
MGWADLLRCPLPGLLHGAATALFGIRAGRSAATDFWIMAGTFSGFLLVAPLVATGLYAISRALQSGARRPRWPTAGGLAPARRAAGAVRRAAGAGRHRLGADLGSADHQLREPAGH